MYQPPHLPPNSGVPSAYVPTPPRRHLPTWAVVLISLTAVGLFVVCGTGALFALNILPPATSPSPTLPATVGESLVVNHVTVTLVSANVTSVYSYTAFQDVPGVVISLHFWNQTAYGQYVSITNWKVTADGGAYSYSMPSNIPLQAFGTMLEPNQTFDVQFTVPMEVGDHGPYVLQTDFTTSQGQRLAWTFNA